MSKISALLMLFIAFTLHASEKNQPQKNDETFYIFKTDTPIKIDGKLDDPAWKNARSEQLNLYDKGGKTELSESPPVTVKYCWDENYLYLGYDLNDKDLVAVGDDDAQGPKGNKRFAPVIDGRIHPNVDVVEFFITFGSHNFFWEIHHNANNNFADSWCTVADRKWKIHSTKAFPYAGLRFGHAEWIKDYNDGKATLQRAVQLKLKKDGKPSTINDSSDVDTGYVGEIRLPIGSIAVPQRAELWESYKDKDGRKRRRSIGFNLDKLSVQILSVCQNLTHKYRYHHNCKKRKPGFFHTGAKDWKSYKFTKAKSADEL